MKNNVSIPLISVCIPAYNHERFVVQALNSVLDQDWENKELVIVNDGSRDGTEQIIRNWISEHGNQIPVTFLSQENQGIPKTLNRLVDLAKGEYIAWLASDDYLLPESLSSRIEFLRSKPDRKAVFGDAQVVDENNTIQYESGIFGLHEASRGGGYEDDTLLKNEFLLRWSVPGPVLLVAREVYDIVGPYDELLAYEDWHFYLNLACRDLITFIDRPVAGYRWHDGCISRQPLDPLKSIDDEIHTLDSFVDFYKGELHDKLIKRLSRLKRKRIRRRIFSVYYKRKRRK